MTRLTWCGVLVVSFAGQAPAQNQTPASTAQPQLNPLLYSGTPVGTAVLKPVGTQFQTVGQRQGTNIGMNQATWQQDPIPVGGKLIDLKNSVAPVPMSSLPPALRTQEPKSLFDQIYDKWATSLGLKKADEAKTGYVPGMTRRAKERRERRWIWD